MSTRTARRRAPRGEGTKLRDEILEATQTLLLETGDADAVSIRAIADAVGVTPPSIYLHFSDKDSLVNAVCERHFVELERTSRAAIEGESDPVAALKAMGRAYVRFGLEHPEEYRILFMCRTPTGTSPELFAKLADLSGFNLVVEAVQRCIDAGRFRAGDAFTMACGLWLGAHGVTSLLISKPGFPWPDGLVEHCLDAYCRGLEG